MQQTTNAFHECVYWSMYIFYDHLLVICHSCEFECCFTRSERTKTTGSKTYLIEWSSHWAQVRKKCFNTRNQWETQISAAFYMAISEENFTPTKQKYIYVHSMAKQFINANCLLKRAYSLQHTFYQKDNFVVHWFVFFFQQKKNLNVYDTVSCVKGNKRHKVENIIPTISIFLIIIKINNQVAITIKFFQQTWVLKMIISHTEKLYGENQLHFAVHEKKHTDTSFLTISSSHSFCWCHYDIRSLFP